MYLTVKTLDIQILVSDFYGVPVERMHARTQLTTPTRARHVAMYLVRSYCRMSYPEIGRLFGRDHSTVLHAVRRVGEDLAALRDEVSALRAMIDARRVAP